MQINIRKIFAGVLVIFGALLLLIVTFPIFSYLVSSREKFPKLISPLDRSEVKVSPENYDYTRASNWFIGDKVEDFNTPDVNYYTISIPKLGIEDASAAIGGEDLSKSLIHYPGTALPGKKGNSVIFGHSILPIFFDATDYLAIFSTLPSLNKGDDIFVDFDGISYKYQVENMFEVTPEDIQILEQEAGSANLTLVTCTPPGDPRKPRRLIVRAKLIPA